MRVPLRHQALRGLAAAVLLLTLAAGGARSEPVAPTGAKEFVADLVGQAVGMVHDAGQSPRERQLRLRALMDRHFDMPDISRFVLGRYWEAASDGERREFSAVFADYMVAMYVPRIGEYGAREFKVTGQRAERDDVAMVSSTAAQPNGAPPIVIDWYALRMDGGYRITDVIVSGVSVMQIKRDEIGAVMSRSGGRIAGMIAELRSKTAAP